MVLTVRAFVGDSTMTRLRAFPEPGAVPFAPMPAAAGVGRRAGARRGAPPLARGAGFRVVAIAKLSTSFDGEQRVMCYERRDRLGSVSRGGHYSEGKIVRS